MGWILCAYIRATLALYNFSSINVSLRRTTLMRHTFEQSAALCMQYAYEPEWKRCFVLFFAIIPTMVLSVNYTTQWNSLFRIVCIRMFIQFHIPLAPLVISTAFFYQSLSFYSRLPPISANRFFSNSNLDAQQQSEHIQMERSYLPPPTKTMLRKYTHYLYSTFEADNFAGASAPAYE